MARLEPILDAAHERLDGVVFECLPWADLISRYDGPDALFYLDPPYWGGEDDYGKEMFSRTDFQQMADVLSGIEGAFLLSINDRQETRDTFSAFKTDEVRLTYTVGRQKPSGKIGELIISNRSIRAGLL